uniref:HMG box domain-containing protein n=1 Tax=Spongospora subterranea TaxID=70186 RepID=A0A0H5R5Z3_9EUKA|eukprot:CRZ09570.1 hypothetical protein [Spongospora subterranea]
MTASAADAVGSGPGGPPAKLNKIIRKKKAPKKKTDPNAPKRPLSAFMHWGQGMRTQLKEENPLAGFGELGKLLGLRWAEMSETDKAPFVVLAERDRERYDQERDSLPRAPKKAQTAFMLFSSERRPILKEDRPELSSVDLSRVLGEEWRATSLETRAGYNNRAEVDKARYEREWSRFSAEYPELAEEQ